MKKSLHAFWKFLPLILCLIAFNFFASALTSRFTLRLDLSADRLYTLSAEGTEALQDLSAPVSVTVLNLPSEVPVLIREQLDRMVQSAQGRLSVTYLDPYTHPEQLSAWQKKGLELQLNTLIAEGVGYAQAIPLSDLFETDENGNLSLLLTESRLIPVIRQAASPVTHTVQFIEGHDEDVPEALYTLLKDNGYITDRVPLSVSTPDADLLLLTAPKRDFEPSEVSRLTDYLVDGGKLLVFLGPDTASMPLLCDFLSQWGIGVTDSVIAEKRQYVDGNPLMIVPVYTQHPVCRIFSNIRLYPVLSQSVALSPLFSKNGNISVEKVLYSSDRAYVSSGTAGSPPFTLALSASQTVGSTRSSVVVFGSSGLYSDSLLNAPSYANAELILQAAAYCLDSPYEDALSLPARSIMQPSIAVTAGMQRTFTMLFIVILPAAVLLVGSLVVYRRKRL